MGNAPKRLDHFVLQERIGAGGMGEVYRAKDTDLSREVAIKVLPPGLTGEAERRERFLREARAAAGLKHANVVVIYAVGESEGACDGYLRGPPQDHSRSLTTQAVVFERGRRQSLASLTVSGPGALRAPPVHRRVLGRVRRGACEVAAVAVKRTGQAIRHAITPTAGLVPGLVSDLTRSRTELLIEKALLRQQLIVLRRCVKRPKRRGHERGRPMPCASAISAMHAARLFGEQPVQGAATDERTS